jgi:Putative Actinobacterial Holin-X, holin superfamily III
VEPVTDVEQSGEENRSTGELVKQLSDQVTTLIRDELKLAQVEMTNKGKQGTPGRRPAASRTSTPTRGAAGSPPDDGTPQATAANGA